jgi:glycosyltransferase involved in cell wall biosynthesis
VASRLVPFVTEYLLGDPVEEVATTEKNQPIQVGQGAVVVRADDTEGFAFALDLLLSNPNMRKKLGGRAYQITIPYFTWENIVCDFLKHVKNEEGAGCQ